MNSRTLALIAGYLTILVVFAIADGIWLGVIAMPWYQDAFAGLLRETLITWPWVLFYLAYSASVVLLTVRPYLDAPLSESAIAGLVLGATAYGTYNLTGYSIIAGWPLDMSLVDWLWGSFATALMAWAGAFVSKLVLQGRHLTANH